MTSPVEPRAADLAVVGAGPAGLAAAAAAAEAGAAVLLVDAGTHPGGQYWRHGAEPVDARLYHGWSSFAALRRRVAANEVTVLPRHHVQTVMPVPDGWSLTCLAGDEPATAREPVAVRARRLVLSTGAYDRQLPFPGWDLPGVLAAGGVQALLKSHGVLAGQRVVVAGTGPFLLPVAAALLSRGAQVPVVAEANSPAALLRYPGAVARSPAKLGEALGYLTELARHRTPYRRRTAVLRALGSERLEAVELARLDRYGRLRPGTARTVACDALAVGWGFTPQLDLFLQAGCQTAVGADGSLIVTADENQATSVPGIWAAGESTGVGGAELAVTEGEIAGRSAAGAAVPRALHARRARLRHFATALHAAHPVPRYLTEELPGEVPVCRCEEVPAREVREAVVDLAATDARTVKLLTRTGMGWCQGRVCGFGVASLTARLCQRHVTEADLRAFAERPLAVPSTVDVLSEPPASRPPAPASPAAG
jgi:D-hydroxyproline dehydrogenase subunit alpha